MSGYDIHEEVHWDQHPREAEGVRSIYMHALLGVVKVQRGKASIARMRQHAIEINGADVAVVEVEVATQFAIGMPAPMRNLQAAVDRLNASRRISIAATGDRTAQMDGNLGGVASRGDRQRRNHWT